MSRRNIKRERKDASLLGSTPAPTPTPAPPSVVSNAMEPPSRKVVRDDLTDAQSVAASFVRSYAPSAETRIRENDDDQEPMLLEMRTRPVGGLTESPQSTQNADTSFAHQSFAHPTFTNIGMKLRAFNNTVGSLQQLGVSHITELPELVLVGDQSAGKSSLMSGLARVDIPRSAGVGTRCPLHIRLIDSSNAHWSCTVALQLDYDFEPKGKIKRSDVTVANPFPPWVKKSHRDIKIFKTIFDPGEIEEVLRWAQVAILNPNIDHELYVPGDGAIAKGKNLADATRAAAAQFSPNIISLEIKGPELPGLSFYDLPGVFLSPDQEEDEYIVKVVRNLTRHFIQRQGAIIMWALPMNADPENSISLGIIRESKAANRTIGIMTKADKLPAENESQWLSMFRDEKQSVGHGFFATSRPPHIPLEAAGEWEERFFSHGSDCDWPVDFDEFKERCGVDLLGEYISVQLGDAFAQSLPTIKSKVYTRLREIESQLAALPEIPSNVEHEVKKSLYQFLGRMKTATKDSEFSSQWNTLNNQFRDIILKIKPTCRVKEPAAQTIDLSDNDTEVSASTPSRRPRPSDSTMRPTPNKRQRREIETPVTPVKQESFSAGSIVQAPSIIGGAGPGEMQGPFAGFRNLGRLAMDIRDIRAQVRKKQRPGMPRDLVPDEVRETMCLDAVKKWQGPLETYIDKTAELLMTATHLALEESLGILRRRLIFKECQTHLKHFINMIVANQRARLSEMYDSETYQMYMMNEDAFARYKAQELEQLRRARAIYRLKAVALIEWDYQIKNLADMSEEERAKEHRILTQQLPKIGIDPYETEIEVAAFVRGYYNTAATRFVEGVTMNVNSNLFRIMGSHELDVYIDQELGLGKAGPNVYGKLMEEDIRTARLREQLKGELDKLSQAMTSIVELESSSPSGNSSETILPAQVIDLDDQMDEGV
ncbi:putative dynamin family protein [Rosellinia necatrix]|uniref:Putative dynamin family protein n=1 Tax=Rosellinia necatrix TaxID=77044 RepID=A0A1W2TFB3_ROSNE|nr:putative dynamin family protein [Rosellinia necatrix]